MNFTDGKREGVFHPAALDRKPTALDRKRRVYDRLRKRSYRCPYYLYGDESHKAYVRGVREALKEI